MFQAQRIPRAELPQERPGRAVRTREGTTERPEHLESNDKIAMDLAEGDEWANSLDADPGMNIFERAKQLAQAGRRNEDIIRTLKAEGYEEVHAHLSPSFRMELKRLREAARRGTQ